MSFSDTSTYYDFAFEVVEANGTTNFASIEMVTRGAMSDGMAFAFRDAFANLGWPTDAMVTATVTKRVVAEDDYTGDTTTTPPSFI